MRPREQWERGRQQARTGDLPSMGRLLLWKMRLSAVITGLWLLLAKNLLFGSCVWLERSREVKWRGAKEDGRSSLEYPLVLEAFNITLDGIQSAWVLMTDRRYGCSSSIDKSRNFLLASAPDAGLHFGPNWVSKANKRQKQWARRNKVEIIFSRISSLSFGFSFEANSDFFLLSQLDFNLTHSSWSLMNSMELVKYHFGRHFVSSLFSRFLSLHGTTWIWSRTLLCLLLDLTWVMIFSYLDDSSSTSLMQILSPDWRTFFLSLSRCPHFCSLCARFLFAMCGSERFMISEAEATTLFTVSALDSSLLAML